MPKRICHICGTETDDWCPVCVAAFQHRKLASRMTVDERIAELDVWYGPLEIPFATMHQRIEELVGFPVFTHQLANPDRLKDEMRRRYHG